MSNTHHHKPTSRGMHKQSSGYTYLFGDTGDAYRVGVDLRQLKSEHGNGRDGRTLYSKLKVKARRQMKHKSRINVKKDIDEQL